MLYLLFYLKFILRWIIRAKVQFKSPIRTWSNSKGEGKLFSMDLVDESGEIRATGFRDTVDKFYEMIEVISKFVWRWQALFISMCISD